eukprot:2030436-Amphidinium_carterae.4
MDTQTDASLVRAGSERTHSCLHVVREPQRWPLYYSINICDQEGNVAKLQQKHRRIYVLWCNISHHQWLLGMQSLSPWREHGGSTP